MFIVWFWIIFILVIATLAIPGFWTGFFLSCVIVIAAYCLIRWIGPYLLRVIGYVFVGLLYCLGLGRLFKESENSVQKSETDVQRVIPPTTPFDEGVRLEREKAIDEWEKKWKRKHPTRL